ncbi:peptidylprolyl isomerase [Vicingaceae bacterium]|nr:peptidylprolyl isomerase [Vicingaceae bacterium]
MAQTSSKQTKILLSTSHGDIKMVLYNETPKHRDNFIKLVKQEFFNGTLFHRVISNFMIQGGDPESKNAKPGQMLGNGGPGYTVPAEFNTKFIHKKGALSAARLGNGINPKKESSGSQFYIVQGKKTSRQELETIGKRNGINYTEEQIKEYETNGGTAFLDMNYTVFGEVVEGFDVIDKIAAVKKARGDRPVEDIKMTMKIVKK